MGQNLVIHNLHSIVADAPALADVVGEVDVPNQIFSLELVVSVVGIQLALVDGIVLLLLFIVLRLTHLNIVRLVNIFLLFCLWNESLTQFETFQRLHRLTMYGKY